MPTRGPKTAFITLAKPLNREATAVELILASFPEQLDGGDWVADMSRGQVLGVNRGRGLLVLDEAEAVFGNFITMFITFFPSKMVTQRRKDHPQLSGATRF